ncbi:MAG: hypothetical protein IJZ62_03810 [Clostridia bacterium]|nr:hypothetical protein [Clostridia bacterium]
MKKYWAFGAIFLICLTFTGCFEGNNIYSLMSEQAKIYFSGEGEGVKANIAVGKRENPYIMDGVHNELVDFSLITVSVNSGMAEENLQISLSINGQVSNILLELNPLNMSYMADLGYALNGDDEITITVEGKSFELINIGENFEVDCNQAIEIALNSIEDVSSFKKNGKFACEGYLKILDGSKFGGEGLYWCFTLIGEDKTSSNILINTMDKNDVFKG